MITQNIQIEGMNCGSCVRHITLALKELPGVNDVEVSLSDKQAVLHASQPLTEAVIRHAVDEAGYTVVSVTNL